jgi:16S rRNA C967 or C1407 C5-methylase (RsmB/RsmF family)/NOL1/NOP2/fmu family ribosome biogenesis protein
MLYSVQLKNKAYFSREMKNNPSLPKEFEDTLRGKLGTSYEQFLTSLQQPSPVSIRLNPSKQFALESEPVAWSKFGKYLKERPIFTLDPAIHAGAYYVQEASSMFLEQAITQTVDVTKPIRVLDLCAAPGGKSTHMLSLLHRESLLVSNEVIRSRASILAENIQKWGHMNVVVTNNDPEDFSRLTGFFDVIVVDAPCSGEGLFRKDPNAMQEWSPANVDLCSKRQRRILADVWPALKTNGVLIYCTCTYNQEENEETLRWLQSQKELESIPLTLDKTWGIETIQEGNLNGYRFYPHKVKGEGFFLSAVRKTGTQQEFRIKSKTQIDKPSKKIIEQLKSWVQNEAVQFYSWNEIVHVIPGNQVEEIEFLIHHLKIVLAGTPFVTAKHDKLIPEHAAALSIELQKDHFQHIEVNLEEALHFLRKEPIQLGETPKGFALVTYNKLPLGWVNVLDNRSNNLYPKEWRIRMAG